MNRPPSRPRFGARKFAVWLLAACAIAALCGTAVVALPLDAPKQPAAPAAVPAAEQARTIEALKPPKRSRPAIAVLALNDGTEVTDFLIPYAVLRESGLVDVTAVAVEARPIRTLPAVLMIEYPWERR